MAHAPGGGGCPASLDLTGCFWSNFIFFSPGVFQVVMIQWLDYHGIDGGHTGLTVLSSYLGMLLFAVPFLFRTKASASEAPMYHRLFPVVIAIDVCSNVCNQLSIGMCGSMLFMVIYSSIIVFAAVIRWRVFGKPLQRQQSLALAIITVGLVVTAFDGAETHDGGGATALNVSGFSPSSFFSSDSTSPVDTIPRSGGRSLLFTPGGGNGPAPVDPGKIIAGMCLALMGAFGYAVVYVLTEQVTVQDSAPDPYAFASFSGFYGSVLVASYMVLNVGPVWKEKVIAPMDAKQTSYGRVCAVYVGLLFMCGAHNLSFVFLGKNGGGAVVAGVNKAVQTISVFAASAIWFGPEHPEQRMTSFKIVALILVVIGVLVYSAAPKVKGAPTLGNRRGDDDEGESPEKGVEMTSSGFPTSAGTLSQRGGYSALRVVDLEEDDT